MRFLLDAHLSPKRLAVPMRRAGHDVSALSERPELEGLSDAQVLELADDERRILITRNSRDFSPLLREWAEGGRHHCGCILIWSMQHDDVRGILIGVERLLTERSRAKDWIDLAVSI